MTEKELHRLKRQDLLQLLLSQSVEVAKQQSEIDRLRAEADEASHTIQGLKQWLVEKENQIQALNKLLETKDAAIELLRDRGDGEKQSGDAPAPVSAREAMSRVKEILEIAAAEAERYINSVE